MAENDSIQLSQVIHEFPYNPADVDAVDLCDQCYAIAFSVTESTNLSIRDSLNWALVDRLHTLKSLLVQPDEFRL